jgi:hypothetical protein
MRDRILFLTSIPLVVLSQYYFFFKPDYLLDAVLLLVAGGVAFALLVRRCGGPDPLPSDNRTEVARGHIPRIKKRRWREAAVVLSVSLAVWAGLRSLKGGATYVDELALWLMAMGLVLIGFHQPRSAQLTNRVPRALPWAEIAVVSVIVVAGLLLRTIFLTEIPRNISGDGGTFGCWAVDFVEGRRTNVFATGWFAVPTMGLVCGSYYGLLRPGLGNEGFRFWRAGSSDILGLGRHPRPGDKLSAVSWLFWNEGGPDGSDPTGHL